MPNSITLLTAQVKYLTMYTCAACGKKQEGTTTRTNLCVGSTEELKKLIDKQRQRSHDMPVGWGCYYAPAGNIFKCGCDRG